MTNRARQLDREVQMGLRDGVEVERAWIEVEGKLAVGMVPAVACLWDEFEGSPLSKFAFITALRGDTDGELRRLLSRAGINNVRAGVVIRETDETLDDRLG